MEPLLITIWLTISASTIDIGGYVVLPADTTILNICGVSWVPHVALTTPRCGVDTLRHETLHARQWDALGPAFPLAYVATLGRPFEDYKDSMWEPPEAMERNCPIVRLEDGTATFMPCWQMDF